MDLSFSQPCSQKLIKESNNLEETQERFAAIDLGTNTFHILIAEKKEFGGFAKVHQQREYVYLGKDGVEHINDASFQKGIETLEEFANLMSKFKVVKYKMTGTETFRQADNGHKFIEEVKSKFNLNIDIINGQKEAEYIYKGVKAYLSKPSGKYLIMDIGGGSVEFIHFDAEKMLYSESFPIGISVLHKNFQRTDPLGKDQIIETQNWLEEKLQNLTKYLQNEKVDALVGSAGSFEVLSSILKGGLQKEIGGSFTSQEYERIYQEVIPLGKEERLNYPGIAKERVVLIPIAMVLIDFVLKHYGIQEVLVSPYALKEGIIADFIS